MAKISNNPPYRYIETCDNNGTAKRITSLYVLDNNGNKKRILKAGVATNNGQLKVNYTAWYNLKIENKKVTGYYGDPVNIWIPETNDITGIAAGAFKGCTTLLKVHLSSKITEIADEAFCNCENLSEIDVSTSPITSIGYRAFYGCRFITSFTFSNVLTTIGEEAFSGCTRLTALNIPASVTSIGRLAFLNTSYGLQSINVASGNTNYKSINNCLIDKNSKSLLLGCKNSIIPDNASSTEITSIADYAFSGAAITSASIPSQVNDIGQGAFYNCTSLTTLAIVDLVSSSNVSLVIGNSAFYGTGIQNFYSPQNRPIQIGAYAFQGSSLKNICISNDLTTMSNIDYGAFNSCRNLESVEIADNVLVEENIFVSAYSANLRSVILGDNVKSYGSLFLNNSSLTTVQLGLGIPSIEKGLLSGASNLSTLIIPYVGESATASSAAKNTLFGWIFGETDWDSNKTTYALQYYNSSNYVTYYYPKSLVNDGYVEIRTGKLYYGAFMNMHLETITLDNGVTYVGENAFKLCACAYLTIASTVTKIESTALNYMMGLIEVTLPFIGVQANDIAAKFTDMFANTSFNNNFNKITLNPDPNMAVGYLVPKNAFSGLNRRNVNTHSVPYPDLTFDFSAKVGGLRENSFYNCYFSDMYLRWPASDLGGPVVILNDTFGLYNNAKKPNPNFTYGDTTEYGKVWVPSVSDAYEYSNNDKWSDISDGENNFISINIIK